MWCEKQVNIIKDMYSRGFSIPTILRVVNGQDDIEFEPMNEKAVWSVIEDLGYPDDNTKQTITIDKSSVL